MSTPSSCVPGQFNELEGQSECQVCPLGTLCPYEGGIIPYRCTAGYICNLRAQLMESTLCLAGYACEGGIVTTLQESLLDEVYKPTLCLAGTYCIEGTTTTEVILKSLIWIDN
jgi:hypothetical protein